MACTATQGVAALLGGLGLFHLALATGAPWGRAAYGGQHPRTLPTRLRGVSAATSVGYAAAATALVSDSVSARTQRRVLTGVVAMTGPGTVLNGISRSPVERAIWTPYCAATALLAGHTLRR